MPAKLKVPTEKVSWRIGAEDMALLRAVYGGRANTVVRDIIHAACERLRERLGINSYEKMGVDIRD